MNHGFISITEKIKHAFDYGKITCGVFVDQEKVFYTIQHCSLFYSQNLNIMGYLRLP